MPQFEAVLKLEGKTATGIEVPPEVVQSLGSSKKPAVKVRLGSYVYRSTIAVRGDKFMLPVSADHRQVAGLKAGDQVSVRWNWTPSRVKSACPKTWQRRSTSTRRPGSVLRRCPIASSASTP